MNFDFMTLEKYEKRGERLGNWRGLPVFALSRQHLKEKGNGAYYVLYDDDNVLVRYHNGEYRVYGVVDEYGSVNEYGHSKLYFEIPTAAAAKAETPAATNDTSCAPGPDYVPGYDATEPVVGDVKLGIDVDAVLANARAVTVENLLEGFNYGI